MRHTLLAATILAFSSGLALAGSSMSGSSGTSTDTQIKKSDTMNKSDTGSMQQNKSGTDTMKTNSTTNDTNSHSARDCAPGHQMGSAKNSAPGQTENAQANAPGQQKKTAEGC
jgi:hypothetical protein